MATRLPVQKPSTAQNPPNNPPTPVASPHLQPTHSTSPQVPFGLHTPTPTDRYGRPYPETLKGIPMDAQHQLIGCMREELPPAERREFDNDCLNRCSRDLQITVFGYLKMMHVPPAAVKRMIDGEFYRAYPELRPQEVDEVGRVEVTGDDQIGQEKKEVVEMGKTGKGVEDVLEGKSGMESASGMGTKRTLDEAEGDGSPAKKAKTHQPDTGSSEDAAKAELQLMTNAQKGDTSASEPKAELEFIIENPGKSAPAAKRTENTKAKNAISKQMNAETSKYEKRLKSKKKRSKVMRFKYTVPEVGSTAWEKINTEHAARGK